MNTTSLSPSPTPAVQQDHAFEATECDCAPGREAPKQAPTTGCSFEVLLVKSGERFPCQEQESVLKGMARLGCRGIPVGCVGGGCGICKVRILEGQVTRLGAVSRAHINAEEEAAGFTLACQISAATTLRLEEVGYLERRLAQGVLATRVRPVQSTRGEE